jgi:2-methylisocitrate lyase-like PEP mutase family enzyme
VRLENIRDGIEDYECLAVLSELIAEAEKTGVRSDALARGKRVVKVRESVVQSFRDYTLDPDVLLAARTELLRVTQDLSQALKRGRR